MCNLIIATIIVSNYILIPRYIRVRHIYPSYLDSRRRFFEISLDGITGASLGGLIIAIESSFLSFFTPFEIGNMDDEMGFNTCFIVFIFIVIACGALGAFLADLFIQQSMIKERRIYLVIGGFLVSIISPVLYLILLFMTITMMS